MEEFRVFDYRYFEKEINKQRDFIRITNPKSMRKEQIFSFITNRFDC